jgi:2-hydroxyglutarate dehydrogenase
VSEVPGARADAPERCDLAVVGGGIVGLAVARELALRHPRASICVLEREPDIGSHQTAHNSGVIHAGIYYTPGSLKAALCVGGARELYRYCEQHEIEHARCGKVILACDEPQRARLEELRRRGASNGVRGLRILDATAISELEPHARALAGLHSPETGVVDFGTVARSFARDVLLAGGSIATSCGVTRISRAARSLRLGHARGTVEAGHAVFCAGAWSDRLAVNAGAAADPRIVPFRGAYLRLAPERRHLVRSLIYPVPDPSVPFLGVHLTRHLSGEVLIGPTALIAGARDAYALRRVRPRDLLETLAWPGTWRLLASSWAVGVSELSHALRRSAVVRAAARYVPELDASDATPAFAGVRAQALARDGRLIDDFVFSATERALHVRNAPSPAATSSLAIARHVAETAARSFGLAPPSSS